MERCASGLVRHCAGSSAEPGEDDLSVRTYTGNFCYSHFDEAGEVGSHGPDHGSCFMGATRDLSGAAWAASDGSDGQGGRHAESPAKEKAKGLTAVIPQRTTLKSTVFICQVASTFKLVFLCLFTFGSQWSSLAGERSWSVENCLLSVYPDGAALLLGSQGLIGRAHLPLAPPCPMRKVESSNDTPTWRICALAS